MSTLGEIARLSRTARPSAGIITMIGVSHLESLGSRENILKAKLEICQGLPDGAPLVLNADDDLLPGAALPARLRPVWFGIEAETADVRAENIRETQDAGTDSTIRDSEYGEFSVHIPTVGRHTGYDALAASVADLVVATGPRSAALADAARAAGATVLYCQNPQEVVEYLRSNLRPGDVLLAKASHAMQFEEILQQLYDALPAQPTTT